MQHKELRLVWLRADPTQTPPPIFSSLGNKLGWPLRLIDSWEEVTDSSQDPSSVLLTTDQCLTGHSLKKIRSSPVLVLYKNSEGVPSKTGLKIHGVITPNDGLKKIQQIISEAIESKRHEARLIALREHHRIARSFDGSPALSLIIDIVKSCTASETYDDILMASRSMLPILNFSDASLIVSGPELEHSLSLNLTLDKKNTRVASSRINFPDDLPEISFDQPRAVFVRPDSKFGQKINGLRKQPWGSAIAMGFRTQSKTEQKALIILFRKDLFPFTEKDAWILELSYYPFSLALEKTSTLERLHHASAEWRSTFDGISEAVTVINGKFEIVKANRAFATLVDQDIKTLKGRRCYVLLAGRKSPCKNCPVLELNQNSTGKPITGKRESVLAWSYGLNLGLDEYRFQFYRNTSTEVMLASRLIQAEKLAALGKIFSAIAHELNNPIGGILATSQILLREPRQREEVAEIYSAALRAKKIIDTLLGFTSGSFRGPESGALTEAIDSTLMLVKSSLGKIKIERDLAEGTIRINNSPALQQVLFNLFTNAIHALNGSGTISLKTRVVDSTIKIVVADNGPGIPQEKLKAVFAPFVTSKEEGKGTGLGLAIVKTLVERLGGTVTVNSKKGSGTVFTISMPEKKEDETSDTHRR